MLLHFSFSPFISFLLLLIIFYVDIPFSFSNAESHFSVCSRSTFECGAITNITYPFSGNDRPQYCGAYELKCRHNSTEILLGSVNYRVLNISLPTKTLRIAPPIDIWTDTCPSSFLDFSLPGNTFYECDISTRTLDLYYGCPSIPQDLFAGCLATVPINVPTTSVERFTSHQSTVEEVLSNGFEVVYGTMNRGCDQCEDSGGRCGYNGYCYCDDGSERYGTCSRGSRAS